MAANPPDSPSPYDDMQQKTRDQHKFKETEDGLPSITSIGALKLLRKLGIARGLSSKATDILSYLGPMNPKPIAADADDTVWLLDNTAYRTRHSNQWQAEFVACTFSKEPSCTVVDVATQVAELIGLTDQQHLDRVQERIMPFVQDVQPGRTVKVRVDGTYEALLGPGGRNGISVDYKKIPAPKDVNEGGVTEALVPGADGLLQMKTQFAGPEGFAIISDIDDTIKVTQTSDPVGILRTTFLDEPKPIDGMPELFAQIDRLLQNPPFFYLSASPYNLYPFLKDFRESHFPGGTIILRDNSWMTIPGLLASLTMGTQQYKTDRMRRIHSWLPKRKMICIGDSTQTDPESYSDIYRAFPGWIRMILIRKVTDIAAVGIMEKNEPERFERAFKDVPKEAWHVFEDPQECLSKFEQLMSL